MPHLSVGLLGPRGVGGGVLTIADDFVARIALYVAVGWSAKSFVRKDRDD